MTRNRRELDALLDGTADEMRHDLPDDRAFAEAADRVWERLSARMDATPATAGATSASSTPSSVEPPDTIRGCDDVRSLLGPYVAGDLPEGKNLLIEDHTRECLPCRRALMAVRRGRGPAEEAVGTEAGWGSPAEEDARSARPAPSRWMLALAATLVVALGVAILTTTGILGPFGAAPATAAGAARGGRQLLVAPDGNRPLRAGDTFDRGREVRTAKDSGAVVRLADGSRVELAERTEMAVRTGTLVNRGDTTLDLGQGRVIVEAARRSRGHLFVDTEDCRVAVTGTIFAVNHGTKGSRVSVIEGAVRVEQGRREDMLRPGDQVTTRASLTPIPVTEEISWSRDLDRYLTLLAELNALQNEIRQAVDSPLPRTSTRLLDLAPDGTTLYAAVPNVAESMADARRVLSERLETSPVLREALGETGSLAHQEEIDRLIERVRDFGSFLGDEVAFAIVGDPGDAHDHQGAVAYAEVLDPNAFRAYLEQEIERFRAEEPEAEIVLVDDPAAVPATGDEALYLWPTDGFVVASIGSEGLARMAATLSGAESFVGHPFHGLVADAYAEGVEWLLAVNLETLIGMARESGTDDGVHDAFGFEDARHLLVRWSESGERPGGRAVLAFDGPRRGVASWLAEPAPMGSLEFVTADAAAAAAFVVRDPLELVDELLAMVLRHDPEALDELERIEREEGFDLRHDLAAPLGGELAFALDGPLAPKPSFKAVVEVYDPARLQQTLEWAVNRLNAAAATREGMEAGFALTSRELSGRTVWTLSTPAEGVAATYTFVDSYLVATPSPALLDTAIRARQTGANLLASGAFRELLPADGFTNFSAVLYQDLGSRLGPIADALAAADGGRELSAEERATLEEAGELRPPTLGYAYGLEDRLVFAASIGGDGTMPLSALLGSGGGLAGLGDGLLGLFGPYSDQAVPDTVEGGP